MGKALVLCFSVLVIVALVGTCSAAEKKRVLVWMCLEVWWVKFGVKIAH